MQLWPNRQFLKMTWRICAWAKWGKNLADEIQSAQSDSGKPRTKLREQFWICDLRMATIPREEQAVENLFASEKLPLAILINGRTRGAAVKLAADFARSARRFQFLEIRQKICSRTFQFPLNVVAEKDFF